MSDMILKYIDYIKEGFWSKGIERSKNGETRGENKSIIDDYIKTIKWVDLGHVNCLFAEKDYDKPLTLEQIQEIESNLPDNIYYE